MSDRMSRQTWERLKVGDFERLEADLAQATARADALAIEHAELRVAADALYQRLANGERNDARPHEFEEAAPGQLARCVRWMCGACGALASQPFDFDHRSLCRYESLTAYRRLRSGRVPESGEG